MTLKEKDQIDVVADVASDTTSNQDLYKVEYHYEVANKWKFFFLNEPGHPLNADLFDGEDYDIDTILTYEDDQRTDKKTAPVWKKIIGFFWDPIFLPPSERKYMLKIDFFIYIYAILACFIKYLDQTNINNAFVSGMKEDLNMYGSNDYNLLTTYFNIGYLSFSVPMSILMKYIRPSILLPSCEILWTFLVMIMAVAKNKETIYGLRLLQGVIEASSFPGLTMLIGEYYSKESLGKRMFMLDATGSVARMFAGYIQAGVYTTMNGRYGLPGWKWVFLVDGFISIPVAILGFLFLPDFPRNSKAFWLKKKERQFALARAKLNKKAQPKPMTIKSIIRTFTSWKLWLFVTTYATGVIGLNSTSYFALYLKWLKKYSVQQINLIPTAGSAWQFLSMLIFSAGSDYTGNRVGWICLNEFIGFLSCLLLSIWNIPFGALIFAFILGFGTLSAQTILMGWFADVFYDEPDLKAINIGLGNTIVYSFNAFLPLGIYKSNEGPRYNLGYKISMMFFIIGFIMAWVFWFVTNWYNRKRDIEEAKENPKDLNADA